MFLKQHLVRAMAIMTNAPATFQQEMHDIFREEFAKFVVIFLDDILVYSRRLEEHAKTCLLCFTSIARQVILCEDLKM